MPEVFIFGFGAVVFWNFDDESSEFAWMAHNLVPHDDVLGHRHNIECINTARDVMGFRYGEVFRWKRDVVQLRTRDAGEKMAVSFALSKSANISIYEWRMEEAVRRNAHIPEALAKHGELRLRRNEIDVEIGRLYLLNNAINLTTNMLDTPEVREIRRRSLRWKDSFCFLSFLPPRRSHHCTFRFATSPINREYCQFRLLITGAMGR
jgi:uncharacterized Rmd1/YagE family protein